MFTARPEPIEAPTTNSEMVATHTTMQYGHKRTDR